MTPPQRRPGRRLWRRRAWSVLLLAGLGSGELEQIPQGFDRGPERVGEDALDYRPDLGRGVRLLHLRETDRLRDRGRKALPDPDQTVPAPLELADDLAELFRGRLLTRAHGPPPPIRAGWRGWTHPPGSGSSSPKLHSFRVTFRHWAQPASRCRTTAAAAPG